MDRAKPGVASAWRKFELRAYRLPEASPLIGSSVTAAKARVPEHRLFIHRVRRGGRIVEAEPGSVHDYRAEPGRDLILISRHGGIEMVDGSAPLERR